MMFGLRSFLFLCFILFSLELSHLISATSDVNECKMNCSPNATCKNTNGSFECKCNEGYEGNGMSCDDIDECLFALCVPGADCMNSEGSFICTCKDGYEGNGTYCKDKDECKDGSHKCDKNADCKNIKGSYKCLCKNRFRKSGKQCLENPIIPYSNAINTTKKDLMYGPYDMYGGILAFRLYFSKVYVSQNGYFTFGSDPKFRAQQEESYAFPKNVPIFAPFWTALDLSANGKIYVDQYKRCKVNDRQRLSVIDKVIGFKTESAMVITWENVSPYPVSEFANETITFQAAILSSGYSLKILFNYDDELIKLNRKAHNRKILLGYFNGKKYKNLINPKMNVLDWLKKHRKESTGMRITLPISRFKETSLFCQNWFCENEKKTLPVINAAIPCPCTKQQAQQDYTFQYMSNGCFQTVFARNEVMQTCCYEEKWGALLLGFPGGGNTYNKNENIMIGQKHCCTDYKLCNLFYDVYPSSNCSNYQPPKKVLIWDPLVFNFASGGDSIIFYGSGDYNLINTTSLKLKARIQMEKNTFTPTILSEFPVYTIFAIEFGQEKVVFTTNGSSISATPSRTLNIKVEDISGEKLVRTPIMQMKVMLNKGQIGVTLIVPAFESSTSLGLLSKSFKDGKTLGEKIYKTFEAYKIDNCAFTPTPAKNFKVDLELFQEVNAKLTKLLQENLQTITDICGLGKKHCAMKMLLKNETIILDAEIEHVKRQQILGNFPPVFENASPTILVHKNILMKIEAKDPEKSKVAIRLDTQLKNGSYKFRQNVFNWTFNRSGLPPPSHVKFFATDPSSATTLYWPEVYLCSCRDRSECRKSAMYNKRHLRFPPRMYRLTCDCKDGYTGYTCEERVPVCVNTTCYPEVPCNESNPDHPCGPCPLGLEGDGVRCYDVNSCSKGVCDHNCEDLHGNNYTCSCRPGYVLEADKRTCKEINECQGVNNCTGDGEYCENTKGSYTCKCKLGYIETNGSCLSLKGKTKLAGSLVFVATPYTNRAWSEDLKDTSSSRFKQLAKFFKESLLKVLSSNDIYILNVTSFEKVGYQQKREKRAAITPLTRGNFDVIGMNVIAQQLEKSLKTDCKTSYCKIANFKGITPDSISLKVAPICPTSPCDPISTLCFEQNGYKCECKTGFENLESKTESCKDIDECPNNPCGSVNCTNIIGSYKCVCDFGFVFNNDTKKCVDVCSGDVCNQGICIKTESSFRCSCKVGWTGKKCQTKDAEKRKMKFTLIIVGVVLSCLCLIFIIIIIVKCCYCKSQKSKDLSQSCKASTTWSGLPRPCLKELEMNENGSRLDPTKNTNESLLGIQNPAFDPAINPAFIPANSRDF